MSASRFALATLLILGLFSGTYLFYSHDTISGAPQRPPTTTNTPTSSTSTTPDAINLEHALREILSSYRKVIVLLAEEKTLSDKERQAVNQVGQGLFHDNQNRISVAENELGKLLFSEHQGRFEALANLLDYVESGKGLFDADRLAFREVLQFMQQEAAKDSSLPSIKLHKRISEDLEALDEIEHTYEKEISQIFGRFEQRAIQQKRERWEDYVAHLKKLYSREQILKEYGVILPYSAPKPGTTDEAEAKKNEIYGYDLPAKTVALTFDDGPHRIYTEEIAAILKQYDVPAVFFSVGHNLGKLTPDGQVKLSSQAEISRKLMSDGYVLGNHSFTHAQLSKVTGDTLNGEILNTDAMLKAINPERAPLFRFPYGASNSEGLQVLKNAHLKSVMWNVDSLDWADPLPSSIADRVLQTVNKEGRGIILFHDIHERSVKALPIVLDRLIADGYQFAAWDGNTFKAAKASVATPEKTTITTGYGDSWAIVIGIDDYAKWPKLQYAARDAQAMRQILIEKYGFNTDRVFSLENADATRNGILAAFHDKLAHGGIQKNDRIFVFFAGHGATRKLSSGRDLGYIVPVDANPNQLATDAIPMTEIQNIAESLTAKHVLFVMDACYSGLGLTRGANSASFLRDNAKRIGRQMLTAGGTDQMVADGGPNGHSIFTWTLMQGLSGKGDLNGDGMITATELAAYVAPAVASVSQQTPAFGSLPGSQGGEFVFELPGETEFISEQTTQLSNDAIALNSKLDSSRPAAEPDKPVNSATTAPVIVKDLQGGERKITLPAKVPNSMRQLAQLANDRGLHLFKEKQYPAAESEFTEALRLRPDFALAANNLGFVYYKQEKYKEAVRWFENTIKIDPSRAIAYLNLGDAHIHCDNHEQAKKAYQTFLELNPKGSGADYARQQLAKL